MGRGEKRGSGAKPGRCRGRKGRDVGGAKIKLGGTCHNDKPALKVGKLA